MKLIHKILIIFFILFVFCTSHIYAIDMFLNSSSIDYTSSIVQDEEAISNDNNEDSIITTSLENIDNNNYLSEVKNVNAESSEIALSPTITTTGVKSDGTLSTSDVINIILIAVCVVLILLAIAILIRCK